MNDSKNKALETPWGFELLWASAQTYSGKMLVFTKAGNKTPFGFTKQQERSWFVNSGSLKLRWIDTSKGQLFEAVLSEGQTYYVPPFLPVSLEAINDNASVTEVNNGTFSDDYCMILKSDSIGN
jgi:uncharacterized RmlC-like cupin family protein